MIGIVGDDSERSLLLQVLEELKDLKNAPTKQQELICKLEREVVETKEELKRITEQLKTTTGNAIGPLFPGNGQASYVDIARTPPDSPSNNDREVSSQITTPAGVSALVFCTIDVSRVPDEDISRVTPGEIRTVVESEVRREKESPAWRCRAITTDLKSPHRIRSVCRDKKEHQVIKDVAERNFHEALAFWKTSITQSRWMV